MLNLWMDLGEAEISPCWKCKVVFVIRHVSCAVWDGRNYKKKLATMGGSKGGKHPTGKGKSKSMKNEMNHTTPAINSKHLAQATNDKARELGNSKDKSPNAPTALHSRYKESELEECLFLKLEDLYTRAKKWLLASGYDTAVVERAILHYGYIHGPKDLMNNILTNTIAFIKQKVKPRGRPFEDMKELLKTMIEALIDNVLHTEPHLQRSEAMWLLLARKWGCVPSTSQPSHVLSGDAKGNDYTTAPDVSSSTEKAHNVSNIESLPKKVGVLERICNTPALASQIRRDIPILRESIQREMGTTLIEQQDLNNAGCELIEGSHIVDKNILAFLDEVCVKRWQESSPNDLKTALIIDLMKSIRDLEEKVKVQKAWAEKKVIESAKRLSKDLLELNMLKLEKVDIQCLKDQKLSAENTYMSLIKETERTLRKVNCEASTRKESVKTLEVNNKQIRADTGALRLSASEYGSELNRVINREMRLMKKLGNIGKQTSNLRANCDEEKQKVLELQQDILQAEKEAQEAEDEWKQEIKEKEQMFALVSEEVRKAWAHKANLRAMLVALREDTENNIRVKKNDVKCLEEELSRLRMFYQLSNVSLEGDTFLYNGIEVSSLEQSATHESSRHWNCMMCSTNEVSVVFLPCTHQVLCAPCHEGRCSSSTSVQRCPYCGAEVQQCIKAYGPT